HLQLDSAGQTAFCAPLTDLNDRGIWLGGPGTLSLLARAGDPAPGTPSGVSYSFLVGPQFVLNDAGQIAFFSMLSGPEVDSSNNAGIWSQSSGSLALVARTGSQAPGTPSGVAYSTLLRSPFLNSGGQTAFWGTLTGSGVDPSNEQGIWVQ